MARPSSPAYAATRFRLRPQLRGALARLNLPQNELARTAGISSGYMSQLLSGTRLVGPRVRARLIAATRLEFCALRRGSGRMSERVTLTIEEAAELLGIGRGL